MLNFIDFSELLQIIFGVQFLMSEVIGIACFSECYDQTLEISY